ncbi:hypothetical protein HAX54_027947 [Datura stramonium]|uniref:Uncharacterized protein n=1 Tax=Datura stramonium TaxID=4076 RepID=A0ABS8V5C8_DATST|nr:hypothetical protein [Datura stramonium]
MPASWEPKVTTIEEAKQMSTMKMDELIGNLQTYELKKIDKVAEEPKKERNLILKDAQHDLESDDVRSKELEREDGENDNLDLMARSDTDSDNDSTEAEVSGSNKNDILIVVAPEI